jgi:tRNA modification GTPase
MAGGALSQQVEAWQALLLALSAQVEAVLDFGDEDDVAELPATFSQAVQDLAADLAEWLERPSAEPLKEGFRVVLGGPPNAGKSTLFNALVDQAAAITAATPGTTRDVLERPVAIEGVPFTFVDTAGLRAEGADAVEQEGVERAKAEFGRADLMLWLGPEGEGPDGAIEVAVKADLGPSKASAKFSVSAATGIGVGELKAGLANLAREALPVPGAAALNLRQRTLLAEAHASLTRVGTSDPLLVAECLRRSRLAFDQITGRASTENMLDALFGRFCIGK